MRPLRRFLSIAVACFIICFIVYRYRYSIKEKAMNEWDDTPFSHRYWAERYDFIATEDELSCLSGYPSIKSSKPPIPNIVHFVVGLNIPDISYYSYLAMKAALQSIQPEIMKIHHTGRLNVGNEFVRLLLKDPRVQIVIHSDDQVTGVIKNSDHYAHLADILRLQVLKSEGGIYLDSDVFALKSFDNIRKSPKDVILGNEGGDRNGLCNAVIIARPGAKFINRWLESYKDFKKGEWNDHSVLLPKKWAEANPDEVCQLSPHSFFWPTWTRRHVQWMHKPLTMEEIRETKMMLFENNGSLYDGQVAYHAWNQISYKSFLSQLNDTVIAEQSTRFNIMVQRFTGVE